MRALSTRTRTALEAPSPFKAGEIIGAAPLLRYDACGRLALEYSQSRRENVEWADDVEQSTIDALRAYRELKLRRGSHW